MKKIKTYLPWNLPEYYPSNGVHDLYEFLLEKNNYIDYSILHILNFNKKKILINVLRKLSKFFSFFSRIDISHISSLLVFNLCSSRCKLNFFHTSPIFAKSSSNPYFFHLEDFQTIFLHIDIVEPSLLNRDDLKKIFESNKCLSVVSHIPETLLNFREYFKSTIINNKLIYHKISLSDNFIETADNIKIEKSDQSSELVFLFISSQHMQINNLVSRGLTVCINLAIRFLNDKIKAKFIFKCKRLNDEMLLNLGYTMEEIQFIQSSPSIVWYEEYLSDSDMVTLFKMSDFFLLPSAQLHSMSILKSMYCGAIPVVNDIVGIDQYCSHLINSLIISGVKEKIYRDKFFLTKPDLLEYGKCLEFISNEVYKNIIKLIEDKGLMLRMKNNSIRFVKKNYCDRNNVNNLLEVIYKKYQDYKKLNNKNVFKKLFFKFFLSKDMTDNDIISYKTDIIPRKIVHWNNSQIFKLHSLYYFIQPKSNFNNILKFSKCYQNFTEAMKASKII